MEPSIVQAARSSTGPVPKCSAPVQLPRIKCSSDAASSSKRNTYSNTSTERTRQPSNDIACSSSSSISNTDSGLNIVPISEQHKNLSIQTQSGPGTSVACSNSSMLPPSYLCSPGGTLPPKKRLLLYAKLSSSHCVGSSGTGCGVSYPPTPTGSLVDGPPTPRGSFVDISLGSSASYERKGADVCGVGASVSEATCTHVSASVSGVEGKSTSSSSTPSAFPQHSAIAPNAADAVASLLGLTQSDPQPDPMTAAAAADRSRVGHHASCLSSKAVVAALRDSGVAVPQQAPPPPPPPLFVPSLSTTVMEAVEVKSDSEILNKSGGVRKDCRVTVAVSGPGMFTDPRRALDYINSHETRDKKHSTSPNSGLGHGGGGSSCASITAVAVALGCDEHRQCESRTTRGRPCAYVSAVEMCYKNKEVTEQRYFCNLHTVQHLRKMANVSCNSNGSGSSNVNCKMRLEYVKFLDLKDVDDNSKRISHRHQPPTPPPPQRQGQPQLQGWKKPQSEAPLVPGAGAVAVAAASESASAMSCPSTPLGPGASGLRSPRPMGGQAQHGQHKHHGYSGGPNTPLTPPPLKKRKVFQVNSNDSSSNGRATSHHIDAVVTPSVSSVSSTSANASGNVITGCLGSNNCSKLDPAVMPRLGSDDSQVQYVHHQRECKNEAVGGDEWRINLASSSMGGAAQFGSTVLSQQPAQHHLLHQHPQDNLSQEEAAAAAAAVALMAGRQRSLNSVPISSWKNRVVSIATGPFTGRHGRVLKWGNGWVTVELLTDQGVHGVEERFGGEGDANCGAGDVVEAGVEPMHHNRRAADLKLLEGDDGGETPASPSLGTGNVGELNAIPSGLSVVVSSRSGSSEKDASTTLAQPHKPPPPLPFPSSIQSFRHRESSRSTPSLSTSAELSEGAGVGVVPVVSVEAAAIVPIVGETALVPSASVEHAALPTREQEANDIVAPVVGKAKQDEASDSKAMAVNATGGPVACNFDCNGDELVTVGTTDPAVSGLAPNFCEREQAGIGTEESKLSRSKNEVEGNQTTTEEVVNDSREHSEEQQQELRLCAAELSKEEPFSLSDPVHADKPLAREVSHSSGSMQSEEPDDAVAAFETPEKTSASHSPSKSKSICRSNSGSSSKPKKKKKRLAPSVDVGGVSGEDRVSCKRKKKKKRTQPSPESQQPVGQDQQSQPPQPPASPQTGASVASTFSMEEYKKWMGTAALDRPRRSIRKVERYDDSKFEQRKKELRESRRKEPHLPPSSLSGGSSAGSLTGGSDKGEEDDEDHTEFQRGEIHEDTSAATAGYGHGGEEAARRIDRGNKVEVALPSAPTALEQSQPAKPHSSGRRRHDHHGSGSRTGKKISKGDMVIVLCGSYSGSKGRIVKTGSGWCYVGLIDEDSGGNSARECRKRGHELEVLPDDDSDRSTPALSSAQQQQSLSLDFKGRQGPKEVRKEDKIPLRRQISSSARLTVVKERNCVQMRDNERTSSNAVMDKQELRTVNSDSSGTLTASSGDDICATLGQSAQLKLEGTHTGSTTSPGGKLERQRSDACGNGNGNGAGDCLGTSEAVRIGTVHEHDQSGAPCSRESAGDLMAPVSNDNDKVEDTVLNSSPTTIASRKLHSDGHGVTSLDRRQQLHPVKGSAGAQCLRLQAPSGNQVFVTDGEGSEA